MEINFLGKKALVTGACRGIGREIAKLLVSCNAMVIAVGKSASNLDLLKQELPTITTICVDLSDWNATRDALKPFSNDVELLVNNAGYAKCTPLGEITEEECDYTYNVNVKAIINVTQCLIGGMKQRCRGSIVNVSSVAGMVGLRDHLVYGGSKAAVDLITKIMSLELGEFNIRVNSINPGVTKTDMAMVGWSDPVRQEWMLSKCPLARFSEPLEVAKAVVYLLSDQSSMINSVNLVIDGGMVNTKL